MDGKWKVYFRKNAAYLTDLETELLLFPMAAHDDIVDTFSIAADDIVNPSGSMIWSMDDDDTPSSLDEGEYPSAFHQSLIDEGDWMEVDGWE